LDSLCREILVFEGKIQMYTCQSVALFIAVDIYLFVCTVVYVIAIHWMLS